MPVSDIDQCVLRIVNDMRLSNKIKHYAITMLDTAKKQNRIAGRDPMGMAAATIYLASVDLNEKISQQNLAKTAMITEVTIRNSCKRLRSMD